MHIKGNKAGMAALVAAATAIGVMVLAAPEWASPPAVGPARLVSVQQFPEGETCTWKDPAPPRNNVSTQLRPSGAASSSMALLQPQNLVAAIQQQSAAAITAAAPRANGALIPFRTIRNLEPTSSAI